MARSIDPIVSTGWLAVHLWAGESAAARAARATARAGTGLIVIDVRESRFYETGHIPGAISVPFSPESAWATSTDELHMELPGDEDLFRVIGDCGIDSGSKVVIVTTLDAPPAPPYSLSDATRVAATLIYAGVDNVAILDGGHPKWEQERREMTTDLPEISAVSYAAKVRREMIVSTEYVKERMGRSLIVDARDPDVYFGVTVDPFAGKAGHIPTARSLPAVSIWGTDGTYKPFDLLRQMATKVLGPDADDEVIVYCGVGGYASSWWFVLTQLLGYANVKVYDGAAEAWAKDNEMVVAG